MTTTTTTNGSTRITLEHTDFDELIIIEKEITTAVERQDDADALKAEAVRDELRARWKSGKRLLTEKRKPKRGRPGIPAERMAELVKAMEVSNGEIKYRMQFAERYPTEDDLATALAKFGSWTALKKSFPKERKSQGNTGPKPTSPLNRNEKSDEIIELRREGKSKKQIAEETGVSGRTVRRELEIDATIELAGPVDYNTMPGTAVQKMERIERRLRKELRKEFETRLLAQTDQYRAQCDENVAAYKAELDRRAQVERTMRDEERRVYKQGIEVARAKGLITPDDWTLIVRCLHPDNSASEQARTKAFRVFNDPKIKTLLVKEV